MKLYMERGRPKSHRLEFEAAQPPLLSLSIPSHPPYNLKASTIYRSILLLKDQYRGVSSFEMMYYDQGFAMISSSISSFSRKRRAKLSISVKKICSLAA
jgi:hypothetical protein